MREGGYMKGMRPWHGSGCLHSWGCCENSKGAQETFLVVRPTSQGTPTGSSAKPNPSPGLLWSHRVHSLCTFILSLSLSMHTCVYHTTHGEVGGQLAGVGSLRPPRGSQGLNSVTRLGGSGFPRPLSLYLEFAYLVDWWASKPQGSSCPYLPSAVFTGVCRYTWLMI